MKTETPIFSHRISAPAPAIIDLLNRHLRTEIPGDAEISADGGNVQFAWTTEPANPVSTEPATPVSTEPERHEEWISGAYGNLYGSTFATPVSTEPATPVSTEPATPISTEPATPVSMEPATPVSMEPERREEWPEGIDPLEGFVFYGMGPLKVLAKGPERRDVATWPRNKWNTTGWTGAACSPYALRRGSKIAKLNGLE